MHRIERKTGFTLVELLVVIAIISVLAALLLPVLEKARASAMSIACSNNLKECGTALFMYADENNGWIRNGYNWYKNAQDAGVDDWQVLWCPLSEYKHNTGWIQGIYGIHYYTTVFQQDGPSHSNSHYRITNPVHNPAATMLLTDTYSNNWTRQYPIFNPSADYGAAMCLRHPGLQANIVFADSHVQGYGMGGLKETHPVMRGVVVAPLDADLQCEKVTF